MRKVSIIAICVALILGFQFAANAQSAKKTKKNKKVEQADAPTPSKTTKETPVTNADAPATKDMTVDPKTVVPSKISKTESMEATPKPEIMKASPEILKANQEREKRAIEEADPDK